MRNPVHRKSKLTKRRIFMNMNANTNTPEDINAYAAALKEVLQ